MSGEAQIMTQRKPRQLPASGEKLTIVSVNHAAVTSVAMGGEVAMHRQMRALVAAGHETIVLAERGVQEDHEYEGVKVRALGELGRQLMDIQPHIVFGFHEQAIPASLAAVAQGVLSVTRIDAPPRYARHLMPAVLASDAVIYNTHVAAREWGEPTALVVHPPMPELPKKVRKSVPGDPYLVTSNLVNKGIVLVLELARMMPDQEFWVMRSPCEPTHGLKDFDLRVSRLYNVTVLDRVAPHQMADLYAQARIVLVPSYYETYGMAGLEGLAHGKPCVHVATPHALEGVGEEFCVPSTLASVSERIRIIENDYEEWSRRSLARAALVHERQEEELERLGQWVQGLVHERTDQVALRRQRIRRRVAAMR